MAGLSRTLGIFGAFVAVVGAAFYPIYFRPLLLPEEYSEFLPGGHGWARLSVAPSVLGRGEMLGLPLRKEQSINRAGVVQENIQPAGLKVWSDPFGRK
ncbi:small integral membrane protein 20 isoform X1 [Malurus melanocephalus]|uniref:small integral membrane protein 20 isoform X1 n=1 Tax=Malurus melanocephalus TaxID=175006 RepID=UPI002548543D|nr:small integral membrane protein 20 isoform X1 [Malurus melanocephalus]